MMLLTNLYLNKWFGVAALLGSWRRRVPQAELQKPAIGRQLKPNISHQLISENAWSAEDCWEIGSVFSDYEGVKLWAGVRLVSQPVYKWFSEVASHLKIAPLKIEEEFLPWLVVAQGKRFYLKDPFMGNQFRCTQRISWGSKLDNPWQLEILDS